VTHKGLVELIEAALDMLPEDSAVYELLSNGLSRDRGYSPDPHTYTHEELTEFAKRVNREAAEALRERRKKVGKG